MASSLVGEGAGFATVWRSSGSPGASAWHVGDGPPARFPTNSQGPSPRPARHRFPAGASRSATAAGLSVELQTWRAGPDMVTPDPRRRRRALPRQRAPAAGDKLASGPRRTSRPRQGEPSPSSASSMPAASASSTAPATSAVSSMPTRNGGPLTAKILNPMSQRDHEGSPKAISRTSLPTRDGGPGGASSTAPGHRRPPGRAPCGAPRVTVERAPHVLRTRSSGRSYGRRTGHVAPRRRTAGMAIPTSAATPRPRCRRRRRGRYPAALHGPGPED